MQMDMDTEKIRYMSESSNASTSGYSTMSPNAQLGGELSPASSNFSSPVPSPRTAALPNDLSNLHLPSNSPQYQQQQQLSHTQYMQMQNCTQPPMVFSSGRTYMDLGGNSSSGGSVTIGDQLPMVSMPIQQNMGSFNIGIFPHGSNMMTMGMGGMTTATGMSVKTESSATLRIMEQPVEKFRFRYKSEMHGTHGSLNGANSKRTPKTFPEVKLENFNGRAVIRCSLFQWNLESPHSHQLVVRKDDNDLCDPHEAYVSPNDGYVAIFQNMGIIHTAKKYIFEELLKKKTDRLKFELGQDDLSTKQDQALRKETEKEAKDMDLNKVRLCFEAYKVEDNNVFTRIAGPVYSNPINNRKSAQTGELRICRLSHSSGSVVGGEDLILLVEKVNKKNIKVRFFEYNEDDEPVWEEFAKFRESDVHHQYAIVCQTPPYRNKDIDKEVEVYVELVRPTDDERSDPPRQFRYKPRDAVVSRKRRRTCSSAHNSFSSSSSLNSLELPKTVQEQTANINTGMMTGHPTHGQMFGSLDINKSEELNKLLGSEVFKNAIETNSSDLSKICTEDFFTELGQLQTDGVATTAPKVLSNRMLNMLASYGLNEYLLKIVKIHDDFVRSKSGATATNDVEFAKAAQLITDIYNEYAEKNENGDTLVHEIIASDNNKIAIRLCHILKYFNLYDLLDRTLNLQGESVLHCACLHDRAQYIRPLLGLRCNPNIMDQRGNTALHVAIQEKHHKCAESFLHVREGIRPDLTIKNDEGLTPLHLAIRRQSNDLAERLIQFDSKAVHITNSKDGNTALHLAIEQRSLQLVKAILNSVTTTRDTLLTTPNASGLTAIDSARQVGDKIWEYIRPFVKDTDLKIVIKEEEISSSSFTDDEEESNDREPVQSEALELVIVKKEQSDIDAKSSNMSQMGNQEDMIQLLNNSEQFRALVTQLNEQERWKLLAEKLKYNHLICLWSNADDMLTHLRQKNMENIQYGTFVNALQQVLGTELAERFLKRNISST